MSVQDKLAEAAIAVDIDIPFDWSGLDVVLPLLDLSCAEGAVSGVDLHQTRIVAWMGQGRLQQPYHLEGESLEETVASMLLHYLERPAVEEPGFTPPSSSHPSLQASLAELMADQGTTIPREWTGVDSVMALLDTLRGEQGAVMLKWDGARSPNRHYTVVARGGRLGTEVSRKDARTLEEALTTVLLEYFAKAPSPAETIL